MSARQRLTFAAIAVVIAVVAVVVLVAGGGSDDDQQVTSTPAATATATADTGGANADAEPTATASATPQAPRIVVRGGQPVGGVRKIAVKQGDPVAFTIQSDTADEVHVHGFDLKKDVSAGGRVSFAFKATITGVFDVELEGSGTQLASLTVNP